MHCQAAYQPASQSERQTDRLGAFSLCIRCCKHHLFAFYLQSSLFYCQRAVHRGFLLSMDALEFGVRETEEEWYVLNADCIRCRCKRSFSCCYRRLACSVCGLLFGIMWIVFISSLDLLECVCVCVCVIKRAGIRAESLSHGAFLPHFWLLSESNAVPREIKQTPRCNPHIHLQKSAQERGERKHWAKYI